MEADQVRCEPENRVRHGSAINIGASCSLEACRVDRCWFFDFDHGQDGLAFNYIEIHPVLKITIQGKEGNRCHSGPERWQPRLRKSSESERSRWETQDAALLVRGCTKDRFIVALPNLSEPEIG